MLRLCLIIFLLPGIISCSSIVKPGSTLDRFRKDGAPLVSVDPANVRDAIPRNDEITRAGNKNPYTVRGKTYYLLPTSKDYKEEGIASWYGTKFHGRLTSNGERYSLYGMTAAHKTLPIPAYVKVTNLENQKTTIVRVNDRGPFHDDRIIDLSYAAAVKLGYAEFGTARVLVETIDVSAPAEKPLLVKEPAVSAFSEKAVVIESDVVVEPQYFLQVGAFKSQQLADQLRAELLLLTNQSVVIASNATNDFYRVQIGPIADMTEVQKISDRLVSLGKERPSIMTNN